VTSSHTTLLTYPQRLRAERLIEACTNDEDALRLLAFEYIAIGDALTTIVVQHDQDGCIGAAAFDAGRTALNGCALREAQSDEKETP
jgi:hypothetical protein